MHENHPQYIVRERRRRYTVSFDSVTILMTLSKHLHPQPACPTLDTQYERLIASAPTQSLLDDGAEYPSSVLERSGGGAIASTLRELAGPFLSILGE
jgi:hypothetical protein